MSEFPYGLCRVLDCIKKSKDEFHKILPNLEKFEIKDYLENYDHKLKSYFFSVAEQCFVHINISMFNGEYLFNEHFKSELEKVYLELSDFSLPAFKDDPHGIVYDFKKEVIDSNFSGLVSRALEIYKYVFLRTDSYIRNQNAQKLLFGEFFKELDISLSPKAQNLLTIFSHHADLSLKAHSLSLNDENLNGLILNRSEVEKIKNGNGEPRYSYQSVIIERFNFLIQKILLRRGQHNYIFVHDGTEISIVRENFGVNIFSEFLWRAECHYLDRQGEVMRLFEKVKHKDLSQRSLNELHVTMKYKKYFDTTIHKESNLKELCRVVNNQNIKGVCDFDSLSIRLSKNYFFNNYLSFRLKKAKPEAIPALFKELLEETKSLQFETSIENYFPYKKLCFALSQYIDEYLINQSYAVKASSEGPDVYFDRVNSLIDNFNECFNIYKDYLQEIKYNVYFSLPYSESKVSVVINDGENDLKTEIFCPSSFTLPIDYEGIENDNFEDLKDKKEVYRTFRNTLPYYLRLANVENTIKSTEKRAIEIISVFTAVIALAIGSVNIFNLVRNTTEALLFFFTFAAGLTFFVLLIFYVTNHSYSKIFNLDKEQNWIWKSIKFTLNKVQRQEYVIMGFISLVVLVLLSVNFPIVKAVRPINYKVRLDENTSILIEPQDKDSTEYYIRIIQENSTNGADKKLMPPEGAKLNNLLKGEIGK